MSIRTTLASVSGIALLLVLTACGGGGNGSSVPPPGGGSGQQPSGPGVSGLLLPPAALGATLYADANVLRPIRDAASWTYRGVTGNAPFEYAYTTTTTQSVGSEGVSEHFSNAANDGPSTQMLKVANGNFENTVVVGLVEQRPLATVQVIELRSPVRQGERYLSLDAHYPDGKADLDGDGINETLDIAIYADVVGHEIVQFAALSDLRALRVDLVVRQRVTFSKDKQASPVLQATIQVWYAPGIGIVRQRNESPSNVPGQPLVQDEQLTAWDGITTGLGAMPAQAITLPSGPDLALDRPLTPFDVFAVIGLDDGVMLIAPAGSTEAGTGRLLFIKLDKRGTVVSAVAQRGLPLSISNVAFHRSGNGVVAIERVVDTWTSTLRELKLTRFDGQGQRIGAIGEARIPFDSTQIQSGALPRIATDADTLWMVWPRFADAERANVELVLRAYGHDGHPKGPVLQLGATNGINPEPILASSGGRAAVTWRRGIIGGTLETMVSSATAASTVATSRALTLAYQAWPAWPLSHGDSLALLWPLPPIEASGYLNGVGGALLDTNLTPLIAAGSDWNAQRLPRFAPFSHEPLSAHLGTHIVSSTPDGLLWPPVPNAPLNPAATRVSWYDVTSAPLVSARVRHARVATGDQLRAQVAFADRVIFISSSPSHTYLGSLYATVVWRGPD